MEANTRSHTQGARLASQRVNMCSLAWRRRGDMYTAASLSQGSVQSNQRFPHVWDSLAHRLTEGMSKHQGSFPHTQQWNTFAPKESSHLLFTSQGINITPELCPFPFHLFCRVWVFPFPHPSFLPFVFLYLIVLFDVPCDKFQLPLMFMYSMFLFPFG